MVTHMHLKYWTYRGLLAPSNWIVIVSDNDFVARWVQVITRSNESFNWTLKEQTLGNFNLRLNPEYRTFLSLLGTLLMNVWICKDSGWLYRSYPDVMMSKIDKIKLPRSLDLVKTGARSKAVTSNIFLGAYLDVWNSSSKMLPLRYIKKIKWLNRN